MEIPIVEDFRRVPEGVDLDLLLECEFAPAKWAIYTTAVEHRLFDHLEEPLSAEELARRAGFHPKVTRYLLDALVGLRLVIKREGRYENSPTARAVLARWGYVFSSIKHNPFWRRLGELLAGERLEPLEGEEERWDDLAMQRHYALRALAGEFQATLRLMEGAGVFSRVRRFIDLGGGHGIFAIGFVKTHPELEGAVLDLPQVVPITRRFLEAYKLAGKIETIPGDLYKDPIPGRYDLAFMSDVSPGRDEARIVIKKAYDALEDGGVLVIKDMIPHRDWSESFPQLAHQLLILIHQGDPDEFELIPTAEELLELMREAGFTGGKFLGWIRGWCTVVMGVKAVATAGSNV